MKFVQPEEISNVSIKSGRNFEPKAAHIYRAVGTLSIGHGLIVDKQEWPNKGQFSANIVPRRYTPNGSSFRTNTLADNSGWIVRRVK